MTDPSQKLSVGEKLGYSLGDGAANFVFMTMILFQLNFYTDTMGITAAAAGTLLLVGRLWDAFFDPMMGVMADRTNTRWGKFRPWVLWTAVPWAVVLVLAYTVPSFKGTSLIIYAAVTNIMLMTLYSMNNTPYSAMTGVMTADGTERTILSSYRFFAAMIAQLIVGTFTLPFVAKFGHGNNARGWQLTMMLWAAICLVCFVITFATTRERIQPPPTQKSSPREDFGNLLKNGPWIAMFLLTLSHFVYVAMRGGTMYYYFSYYVDKNALFDFLQKFGLTGTGNWFLNTFGLTIAADRSNVASVGFSFFQLSQQVVTIVGVIASAFLSIRFGKKAVALVGFSLTTIFLAAFILLPSDAILATYVLEWARALAYAPTIPLIWAIFADVADYAEWTTGRRVTGVVFATILFALKTGLSLGGAITGWLLSGYGYQPNVQQTEHALLGIRMTASLYPAIFLVVVVICMATYKISKKLNMQIQEELAERRSHYATAGVIALLAALLLLPAHASAQQTTLKDAYKGAFLVGAAVNPSQFFERDARGAALIKQQFNTITPENVLKWEVVHPKLSDYDFTASDQYVNFGTANKLVVIGHTLAWHSQTPRWVFQDSAGKPLSRDSLLQRLHDHIFTVVGRYKGRIRGWDVVNEALNEDGTLRQSPWLRIAGEDFITKAFQWAHEADPAAELYYNDYSLENAPKRNGAVELIKKLQAAGVHVAAVGLQGHDKLDWPTAAQLDSTITAFASLGVKVNITELDVDVLPPVGRNRGADVSFNAELQQSLNPWPQALPDSVEQKLAARYADIFSVLYKHRAHVDRVTFWGVTDGDSWLNNWPVRGRTSYPLLFDRSGKPKPAFTAVLNVVKPNKAAH